MFWRSKFLRRKSTHSKTRLQNYETNKKMHSHQKPKASSNGFLVKAIRSIFFLYCTALNLSFATQSAVRSIQQGWPNRANLMSLTSVSRDRRSPIESIGRSCACSSAAVSQVVERKKKTTDPDPTAHLAIRFGIDPLIAWIPQGQKLIPSRLRLFKRSRGYGNCALAGDYLDSLLRWIMNRSVTIDGALGGDVGLELAQK